MSDLINREALLADLMPYYNDWKRKYNSLDWDNSEKRYCAGVATALFDAICHVRAAPAVDAVEVVRCRDCKYYRLDPRDQPSSLCWRNSPAVRAPNGFCDLGKRRGKSSTDGYVYQQSIDGASRHITLAMDTFHNLHVKESDVDWAMEQFSRVLAILGRLREYAPSKREG